MTGIDITSKITEKRSDLSLGVGFVGKEIAWEEFGR
jgi:hypothetical protein